MANKHAQMPWYPPPPLACISFFHMCALYAWTLGHCGKSAIPLGQLSKVQLSLFKTSPRAYPATSMAASQGPWNSASLSLTCELCFLSSWPTLSSPLSWSFIWQTLHFFCLGLGKAPQRYFPPSVEQQFSEQHLWLQHALDSHTLDTIRDSEGVLGLTGRIYLPHSSC